MSVFLTDNRRGMEVTKNSHGSEQEIKLTCNSCVRGRKSSSITWTLNGKKVNDDIHVKKLKNVYFVKDNPQYYGLWKCSNANCPIQSDGYCLEKESRVSERSETEEMPWSTPAPLDTGKKLMIQIIVGCVIGIIALLGMVVTIFVLWQKLLSRRTSPSKSAKEPKSQVIQNSFDLEKPLENQGKEKDVEMNEGAEGIQYSVLQLKEPEQCQSQRKEGTPAIIYAEMPTGNCSKS
ncbi:PREDICTED: uncharacterized protein LOC106550643 [Thamnophis sirtalis]|uniref:Uncharacterized protein LOC106550643 n=1 Tax=Thamnophis sirtalis TaxID=35019 RepID=A0A6I9YIM9_9SAUR|nr:PREDICTED: uncharacterized protein LOC106550643 [Thamnophis sirtalis]